MLSPRSLTSMPLLLQRHHPECATPKKLVFGKRLADVLVRHIGWFGHLTNAPAFSGSRLPHVPEKLSKTLKRPHLVLVRTRYQVPTKSGRSFFLLRRSVPVFYMPLVWSTKIPTKITENSRTIAKKSTASPVQSPLPSPLPLSVGAASSTRNSNCPICDGMELPPAAGGDEVVSTYTIPEEHAQSCLLYTSPSPRD